MYYDLWLSYIHISPITKVVSTITYIELILQGPTNNHAQQSHPSIINVTEDTRDK